MPLLRFMVCFELGSPKKPVNSFIGWNRHVMIFNRSSHCRLCTVLMVADLLPEEILDHLEGYKGSRPVRIGNGAYDQLQLDIYGELMDSVYLYNKYGTPISFDLWRRLRNLINWVCDNWQSKDEGIWEVRGGRQHFVYSKLMCWVADRSGFSLPINAHFLQIAHGGKSLRDQIYEELMSKGWDPKLKGFCPTLWEPYFGCS